MEELERLIITAQAESPKIDEAIKNLITLVLGQSLAASESDLLYSNIPSYSPSQALVCGKILANAIQSSTLQEYSTWSSNHPQQPHQSAVTRLDDLNKYKSVYFLRNRVVDSNQKICKFFGKSYFLWTGDDYFMTIRETIYSSIASRSDITNNHMEVFLNIFESSLHRDDDIIWSNDLKSELSKSSHRRRQEVLRRNIDSDAHESDITNESVTTSS